MGPLLLEFSPPTFPDGNIAFFESNFQQKTMLLGQVILHTRPRFFVDSKSVHPIQLCADAPKTSWRLYHFPPVHEVAL